MYRVKTKKLKLVKLNNITLEPLDYVFDEYRIGNWNIYYPNIKFVYNSNIITENNYSYVIKINGFINGYFVCDYNINLEEHTFINKYESKLVLHDFAIDNRAYLRLGLLLLNHLIKLAKLKNTKYIEIKKINGYDYFYKVIKRYYKVIEDEDSYYIVLKNHPKKLFILNELDKISYENLMYLYGIKFRIYKNVCIYTNNDLTIKVNRLNNTYYIKSNNINIYNIKLDNKSRDLIFYVIKSHVNNQTFDYYVDYYNDELHIYKNDKTLLLTSIDKIGLDYKLLNRLFIDGINEISTLMVDFDMNYMYYSLENISINILDYLVKKTLYLDNKKSNLKESMLSFIEAKNFNKKFTDIVKFEFSMGNSFSGIKKFIIEFGDCIEIKSNGRKNEYLNISFNEIVNDLSNLYFYNWKSKYNENKNPNLDNCWKIKLKFENEYFEYEGLDDYPNTWFYLIKFISKYVNLDLRFNPNQ